MIKRYGRTAISQYVIVGLVLVALVVIGYLSTFLMKAVPFTDYFAIPWAAGRAWLLEGQNPYDPSIEQTALDAINAAGYSGHLPEGSRLIHPLVNLFFYLPFSLIPYGISRAIWFVALGVLSGLSIFIAFKFSEWDLSGFAKMTKVALLFVWFPGVYSILTGRLSVILIFLLVYGLWLIKSGNYRTAGFVLALTASSVPLTIFILILAIIWSIVRRQGAFLVAFFSGNFFLWIVSVLMLPSWPLDWLRRNLSIYQDLSWIQTPLMPVASLLPGIENFLSIGLHASLIILAIALWIKLFGGSDRNFMWNALVIFVITYFLQVQISISNLLLLIPPITLILKYASDRWDLPGKVAGWLILFLISGGSWILVTPQARFADTNSFPILTVGLPIIIFLSLIWIRWWVVRLTSLPRI